jgi:polyether ionophore transport system permease protein
VTADLAGTGKLARLALRRDRLRLPLWLLISFGLVASTVSSSKSVYPTAADRQRYADTVFSSPGSATLGGPGYGATTLGGIVVAGTGITLLVVVGLVSMLLVIRHTRGEEQSGRAELTGAAVVGRHARLAAALLVIGGANLVIALIMLLVLLAGGLPVAGSLAFALGTALTGWVFAAVAAVAAQVAQQSRSAAGLALAVFGLAFVLRAAGDASKAADPASGGRRLSWLSPIGWAQQVRAYAGERWWVLLLPVLLAVVLVALATLLSARRDVGSGLVPARLGRPSARAGLSSVGALAWRLQRGTLIGWSVAVAVAALVFGSNASRITEAAGDDEDIARLFERLGGAGALVDSYLTWTLTLAGLVATAYAITVITRLHGEETSLRAEAVLGAAVPRWRWVASYLVVALAGAVLLLLIAGLILGLVHGGSSGDTAGEVGRLVGGALARIPAVLVLAGIATALFGVLPRLTSVAWVFFGVVVLISQLGATLRLSQAALDLSPFQHLPRLGGTGDAAAPLLWLTGAAVVLLALGLARTRTRDVVRF